MKNLTSTLFVGIDVSLQTNVICGLNIHGEKLLRYKSDNNHPGTEQLIDNLISTLTDNNLSHLICVLESTSVYSFHVANVLSSNEKLLTYNPIVYIINPKQSHNYAKSFGFINKTDPIDAFVLADFARCGRIQSKPWRGAQFIALQRLTRHRLHLVKQVSREKAYVLNNIFLKFSQLAVLDNKDDDHPFSNDFGATAKAVLTDFFTPEDILNMSLEELTDYLIKKSKGRFKDPINTAELLQKAARDSYRLDKVAYEPLNIAIASSLNLLNAYSNEIKAVDKAIEKNLKGILSNEYQCLMSIPGVGPVSAAGILSEIGSMYNFKSADALAQYAGITWKTKQSGNYSSENSNLSRNGNSFLRYYILEATNSVRRQEYSLFKQYHKKYDESKTHHHKRALALTSRKFIRMIFAMLRNDQLYSNKGIETSTE